MPYSNTKEIRFDLWNLLLGLIKTFTFGVCLLLLYTVFGHHFDFSSTKIDELPTSPSNERSSQVEDDWDRVERGIHVTTGLIHTENFDIVRANCTACHSGKLIAQNRASREGWLQMIRWMQETQGLWDLGKNEVKILDYLATNYAPKKVGRRANINIAEVEWYILHLDE